MSRARSWRDLTVGLGTLATTLGVGAAVLFFARVGALYGRTVQLYAATGDATGILPGSEVWLAGQKIGLVRAVGFRPPTTEATLRTLLTLEVLDEYRPQIRRTARISIRPGGSLVGSPVVSVATARGSAPEARAGDTLYANPNDEFETIRTRVTTSAGTELPIILDNLRVLAVQLRSAQGTLGALGVGGVDRLATTLHVLQRLNTRSFGGRGAVSAFRDGQLTSRARAALDRVNGLRARLNDPSTSVGRFRTDSALWRSIDSVRTDLAEVQRLLDSPDNTAGRLRQDTNLQRELAQARLELDALLADARRNPLRYVTF